VESIVLVSKVDGEIRNKLTSSGCPAVTSKSKFGQFEARVVEKIGKVSGGIGIDGAREEVEGLAGVKITAVSGADVQLKKCLIGVVIKVLNESPKVGNGGV